MLNALLLAQAIVTYGHFCNDCTTSFGCALQEVGVHSPGTGLIVLLRYFIERWQQ